MDASAIIVVKTILCIAAMFGFLHPFLVSVSLIAQHILEVTELLFYGPILGIGPLFSPFDRDLCFINLPSPDLCLSWFVGAQGSSFYLY